MCKKSLYIEEVILSMPRKVVFSEDKLIELKKMTDEGVRQLDIAKHFNVTADTIRRICRENDIEISQPYICVCHICGDTFRSNIKNAKYCKKQHKRICKVCGAEFIVDTSDVRETCSRKCTNLLKYGTEWPIQSVIQKNKLIHNLQSKYGVTNVSQLPDHSDKVKKTCLEKYGVDNYRKTEECQKRIETTCLNKYGMKCNLEDSKYHIENSFSNKNQWNLAHEAFIQKYDVDNPMKVKHFRDKQTKSIFSHYGVNYPSQSPEVMSKLVKSQKRTTCSDGHVVDSTYEQIVYEFLIQHQIPFKQQVPVNYEYQGKTRVTFIDFEIDGQLFECKGSHLLHGCYDYFPENVPTPVKLDVYRKHHVVIITDEAGRDVFQNSNGLKYAENPLIGLDIQLFSTKCKFPYRSDRPKCFYNVKVDGKMSSYDAFHNMMIRWRMIQNRIQYTGGFIDNKQILTALNVTRVCKQPSWFKKSLAKRLLEKYSTSDTVYDLAAGWGARADACKELHKQYVACDLNSELVEWHHETGRNEVECADGRFFRYEGSCTIFICPPYSDPETGKCFEDYNFEGFDSTAKSLSQCDWLKIAMKNAPNFKEAILVCKIVDKGFEKFIVEEIHNKSHFGTNKEYVIAVNHSEIVT